MYREEENVVSRYSIDEHFPIRIIQERSRGRLIVSASQLFSSGIFPSQPLIADQLFPVRFFFATWIHRDKYKRRTNTKNKHCGRDIPTSPRKVIVLIVSCLCVCTILPRRCIRNATRWPINDTPGPPPLNKITRSSKG